MKRAPTGNGKGASRGGLSTQDILNYMDQVGGSAPRRDIARAFSLSGERERVLLKETLRHLVDQGILSRAGKRFSLTTPPLDDGSVSPKPRGRTRDQTTGEMGRTVPSSAPGRGAADLYHGVVRAIDDDGHMLVDWTPSTPGASDPITAPMICPSHGHKAHVFHQLTVGSKVIGTPVRRGPGVGQGGVSAFRLMGLLRDPADDDLIGVVTIKPGTEGAIIQGVSRKIRDTYHVAPGDLAGAADQDVVVFRPRPRRGRVPPAGAVVRVLASIKEPKSLSLIALHEHHIPYVFEDATLKEADGLIPPPLGDREDLRAIPLVTIDDEDARDFDDAVWAAPDTDPHNPGGFHLMVAIADVSYYVRPHSALDDSAYGRGNSIYFPDRVVPMLPERLSNDLCSLRPHQDRPCLAVHMWISAKGVLLRHTFVRALMRSAGRLTYQSVQQAIDGDEPNDRVSLDILSGVLKPLYDAYGALCISRKKRAPLELDLPEDRVYLTDGGEIEKIVPRPRFNAHRLIEEFMILANVAAAVTLSDRHVPTLFRIHEEPSAEKVSALRDFLRGVNITFPKGQVLKPALFNRVLTSSHHHPSVHAIHGLVLRSQAQAVYSPNNVGHFGLNLPRYCHFTSPIRRYADLIVHRALIGACHLPAHKDEIAPMDLARLTDVGTHISQTERRAASAERETITRYITAYLSGHEGDVYDARITGVADFGVFVRLETFGAEGMVPMRHLGPDYFTFDQGNHRLIGRRTRKTFTLGDRLQVRLVESHPLSGSLLFTAVSTSTSGVGRGQSYRSVGLDKKMGAHDGNLSGRRLKAQKNKKKR